MSTPYQTGRYCAAPACQEHEADPAHCLPANGTSSPPTVIVDFHRTGPAKCPLGA